MLYTYTYTYTHIHQKLEAIFIFFKGMRATMDKTGLGKCTGTPEVKHTLTQLKKLSEKFNHVWYPQAM